MDELTRKLIMAAKGQISDDQKVEAFNEALNTISQNISKAVQPLNNITAPLIVAMLRNYTDGIVKQFPEIDVSRK